MFNNSLASLRRLTNEEILLNFNLVREAFNWVLQVFKKEGKKIRYIILAETPISYSNYFYNPINEKDSLFITKKNVSIALKKNIKSKYQMISELIDHGILIIDIYPLPLPTSCYSNKTFFYDTLELGNYWDAIINDLKGLCDKNTKIVLRYSIKRNAKSNKSFIGKFDKTFHTTNKVPRSIGGHIIDYKLFNKLFI